MNNIYHLLLKTYGYQGWWPLRSKRNKKKFNESGYHPEVYPTLTIDEKFEIAVGAILTQNTTWKNASAALDSLLDSNLVRFEKISEFPIEKLAKLIKKSGYFNQKAKKLKKLSIFFKGLNGISPKRSELLSLWGIGPETADSIMLYAFNEPYFIIDLYTRRILSRISGNEGILKTNYDELVKEIQQEYCFNIKQMQEYHALFVIHAKEHCLKTPNCNNCPLLSICNFVKDIEK